MIGRSKSGITESQKRHIGRDVTTVVRSSGADLMSKYFIYTDMIYIFYSLGSTG